MFVRCRRPDDPGVEYTELIDIRRVDLDGNGDHEAEKYRLPGEFAIHSEIYRAHPEVGAVVHGHPRASLVCTIAGIDLEPIFGAYDPGALGLAVTGVPVFPRAVLISTPELGRQMVDTMAHAKVCLLAGHGIVTTGEDLAEAAVLAIKLETLAEVTLQVHATGREPRRLTDADITETLGFLNSHEPRTVLEWTWGFYRRGLQDRVA
jgi:ribulose-5-phosphate 4-epimerase/fuculose-1-phosphate aldolase